MAILPDDFVSVALPGDLAIFVGSIVTGKEKMSINARSRVAVVMAALLLGASSALAETVLHR
ncbi:hypothetical protein, partial [Staphylococcus aureus]|uniref:hypothetical protein n=1 Tax=Staphylococcus aureus TaxID=1280 RepID=UPI0038B3DC53